MNYVDGFVLPVPKVNLAAYRRFARKMGNIWKEYGVLEIVECVADDIRACSISPRGSRRELFARRPRKREGVDVRPRPSDDAGMRANRPGPSGCHRVAAMRQRAA